MARRRPYERFWTYGGLRSGLILGAVFVAGACSVGDEPGLEDGSELSDDDDAVDDDDDEVEAAVGDSVCFPGADGQMAQCWKLLGTPFADGIDNDAYYTIKSQCPSTWGISPTTYFRLWKMDSSTKVAPSFTLDELARTYVDQQYILLQPHAVQKLQAMRNAIGPITVTSGYRPPGYNYGLSGAASCSRHMYGDAFDLAAPVSANALVNACAAQNGWSKTYTDGHVHCDFRNVAADARMFTSASGATVRPSDDHVDATIVAIDGVLTAPAEGFDEGEPTREWTAVDADGDVIATGSGPEFAVPELAVAVSVVVGSAVEATMAL